VEDYEGSKIPYHVEKWLREHGIDVERFRADAAAKPVR
jgi:hypothetical protein